MILCTSTQYVWCKGVRIWPLKILACRTGCLLLHQYRATLACLKKATGRDENWHSYHLFTYIPECVSYNSFSPSHLHFQIHLRCYLTYTGLLRHKTHQTKTTTTKLKTNQPPKSRYVLNLRFSGFLYYWRQTYRSELNLCDFNISMVTEDCSGEVAWQHL